MKSKITFLFVALLLSSAAMAQFKSINYKGSPAFVHEKTPADFPAYFQNNPICEDNLSPSDAKGRCVTLNADGTGFFQNDYYNANDQPATPIKWNVVCNDKGETLKFESEGRTQYLVVMEYQSDYYAVKQGELGRLVCTLLKSADGTVTRVLIDSKYRDL